MERGGESTNRRRRRIRERLGGAVATAGWRLSERRVLLDIEVRAGSVPRMTEPLFFARVRRALEVIERYEPRRLARIRRDVRRIAGVAGGANFYEIGSRTVVLTWPTVIRLSAPQLAMTIVHEATHGRIRDAGVEYREPMRARIEAACVRQEAIFARRLVGGDALADANMRLLDDPWWTPERLHRSNLDSARAHDMPAFLIRMLEWRERRRLARAAKEDARSADR